MMYARAATTALLLLTAACSDSHAPASPEIITLRVSPTTANPLVTRYSEDHLVWIDRANPGAVLLVFLPGTGSRPDHTQLIGQVAAEQGYRVIGLMYPNDLAVVTACASDPDPRCMEQMRAEIFDGRPSSPHVDVDEANSISGRLRDIIRFLDRTRPNEHWGDLLTAGQALRWDHIAVAGLSQGGGHAAFIAKTQFVPRVIMFGAPADGYNGQPAPWMQPGATPASNYYGFRHLRDPFTSISANWSALGLPAFGAQKNVDVDTDFAGSHMLVTDELPSPGSYDLAHPSVCVDAVTPRFSDGSPRFEAAWRYLLGRP